MANSTVHNTRLAVFDIDGTLFRWQLYYEIVLQLVEQDFFDTEEANKILSSFRAWQSRTGPFNEFETVSIAALDAALPRLHSDQFEAVVASVLATSSHKVYSYTRALATQLKQDGYRLLAISGSMQEIAEPFSKIYGFDDCIGWLYERKNGMFTGISSRRTVGKKHLYIQQYIQEHKLSLEGSVMVGDSAGDITMLELADRPIAFNPNEQLLEIALERDWEIVIERKNIAYSLERGENGHVLLAKTDRF